MHSLLKTFSRLFINFCDDKEDCKLHTWLNSLNADQAERLQVILFEILSPKKAQSLCQLILSHLSEPVAKQLICKAMDFFADMGMGSLIYDDNGNISGLHVDEAQKTKLLAFHSAMKALVETEEQEDD